MEPIRAWVAGGRLRAGAVARWAIVATNRECRSRWSLQLCALGLAHKAPKRKRTLADPFQFVATASLLAGALFVPIILIVLIVVIIPVVPISVPFVMPMVFLVLAGRDA